VRASNFTVMQNRPKIPVAILALAVALALFAIVEISPHASASRIDASTATPHLIAVAIRDFKFEPTPITVHNGDTVEWKNYDSVPHTVTEDGGATAPVFDSGNIAPGATWRYLVQKQGTYHYNCTIHPYMKGELIVER
jgi:plastocyanin